MKKRIFSLLLAIICLLTACATPKKVPQTSQETGKTESVEIVVTPQEFEDPELRRAQALGMIPSDWDENALNDTVQAAEMYEMLTKAVQLTDSDALDAWHASMKAFSGVQTDLYCGDGALAIYYAACALGQGHWPDSDWPMLGEKKKHLGMGEDDYHGELFPNANEDSPFRAFRVGPDVTQWNYPTSADHWCTGHFSRVSGKTVFDLPDLPEGVEPYGQGAFVPRGPLRRDVAIRACLRFYEGFLAPIVPETVSGEAAVYFDQADQRREAILNSPTAIVKSDTYIQGETYTGTAYYVSTDGDDSNDGKTEETPWATLKKVNNAKLQPGDAVFFHRGDTWYGDTGYGDVWGQSQVTYSAYGEGEKPRFIGSDPGLMQAENWTEYAKSSDGGTIWVYAKPLPDASGVFFNGGEGWAEKLSPGWTGEYYCNDDLTPFVLEDAMNQDLTFFSALEIRKGMKDFPMDGIEIDGPLYLRCDAGNPAEVLNDLKASTGSAGFSPDPRQRFGNGITVDNLAFYYYGGLGVSCAGYQGWKGTHIQNCDFGFCGGGVNGFQFSENYGYSAHICSGAAIQLAGCENSVINCYLHDCDNKSIAMPIHDFGSEITTDYYDVTFKGNLVERSGAFLMANYTAEPLVRGSYTDILVEDNIMVKSTEAWFRKKLTEVDAFHQGHRLCTMDLTGLNGGRLENVVFRNNVFLGGAQGLLGMNPDDTPRPVFEGNVYAQYENGWAGNVDAYMLAITAEGDRSIASWLGDTTGTVLIIQ